MAVGILLVGGFGTRLMPLTKNTPKPMLTVAGLPVTEHQLAMAKKAGITTVVLQLHICLKYSSLILEMDLNGG